MHMEQTSQQYSQQRLRKAEDVEKRKQYRAERIRMAEEKGEEYVEDPRYFVAEDGVRRRRGSFHFLHEILLLIWSNSKAMVWDMGVGLDW